MRRSSAKKLLRDAVTLLAAGGVIYGAWGIVEVKGWWIGLLMAAAAGVAGWLAIEFLYPLWFGRR